MVLEVYRIIFKLLDHLDARLDFLDIRLDSDKNISLILDANLEFVIVEEGI